MRKRKRSCTRQLEERVTVKAERKVLSGKEGGRGEGRCEREREKDWGMVEDNEEGRRRRESSLFSGNLFYCTIHYFCSRRI